jgi:hypothetical protein
MGVDFTVDVIGLFQVRQLVFSGRAELRALVTILFVSLQADASLLVTLYFIKRGGVYTVVF